MDRTGIRGAEPNALTMLYERSGALWRLNGVRTNSAMQLFSYDLANQSNVIFFNQDGRDVVIDAATQEPWAPADSSNLDE